MPTCLPAAANLATAPSGVDFDKFDPAREEILAQLEAVKRGEVTAEELSAAKKSVETDLRLLSDDPLQLESWWLSQNLTGGEMSPPELAALVSGVTTDDIVRTAQSTEYDAIFYLKGQEGADSDGE